VQKIPKKKIEENLAVILADIEARREKEMPAGIMTRAVTKMCEPLYRGISP
jgi:hypothetical protein